jgi:hypothetical protein
MANAVEVPVSWFGDPAEPAFCFDEEIARNTKLSHYSKRCNHFSDGHEVLRIS